MASSNYTLRFKNAFIDTDAGTITEVNKEDVVVHSLSLVLEELKDRQIDITLVEKTENIQHDCTEE